MSKKHIEKILATKNFDDLFEEYCTAIKENTDGSQTKEKESQTQTAINTAVLVKIVEKLKENSTPVSPLATAVDIDF